MIRSVTHLSSEDEKMPTTRQQVHLPGSVYHAHHLNNCIQRDICVGANTHHYMEAWLQNY